MATADPNDFSGLTDEELRPWAQAPHLDKEIAEVQTKLLGTMQEMNPTGGYAGASELDRMPDELAEFEKMVAEDPEWIGEDEEEEEELGDVEGEDTYEEYEDLELLSQDDGLLATAIDELNFVSLATDESEPPMMSTLVTQALIPQSLANRQARPTGKSSLKSMKSIKFKPNFGGPPLHKVRQAGVSTLKVPQDRNHYATPRPSSSSYTRRDNLKAGRSIMSQFADTPARPSTGSGNSRAKAEEMAKLEAEMAALKAKMDAMKAEAAASEGDAGGEDRSKPSLFASEESGADGKALDDVLLPSPIKQQRPATASTNEVQGETVAPSVLDRLVAEASLSTSASAPNLSLNTTTMEKKPPRKLAKMSKSPRSPKDRFEKRPASGALDKLGISTKKGTVDSKASAMFGKKRLKSIRTLRDQMMSTAGTMTAFSRTDNKEMSKLFDASESIRMTREQCANTMRKQKHDQTWELLETPGFYNQVGPENVFMSDAHKGYQADERYVRAIDPRTFDHSNGIPPSPLRVWAEDAVKSGRLPLFSSGGAIRV